MEQKRVRVDEATLRSWAEIAIKIRTVDIVLHSVTIPAPGSPFALTDELYPDEPSSQWAREPLRSAADHLMVWANHTVPLKQYGDQVVVHEGFRWTFTLVRAALEGAAQSMWLTQAKNTHECVARLVRAIRHDIHEETKAWEILGRDTTALKSRAGRHAQQAEHWAEWGKPVNTLPAMVDLIRSGSSFEGLDSSAFEGMYRVCSAAAHGKDWAIRELQVFTDKHEWRPGQFHLTGYPDPVKLTQLLEDVTQILNLATIRYLIRMGANVDRELRGAVITAAERTPSNDGGKLVRTMRKKFNNASASDPSPTIHPSDPETP